jgi:hypothetical protein
MVAYQGRCGNWHVGHARDKKLIRKLRKEYEMAVPTPDQLLPPDLEAERDEFQAITMRGRFTDFKDVERFALAGNATLTIVSVKTGSRYTFKVKRPDDFNPDRPIWFVSMLRGPDNESDFSYLGNMRQRAGLYEYEEGKKCRSRSVSDVFMWFWRHVQLNPATRIMDDLEVWHEARCGRCNRKLTVPDSVASGFGPECINYV